MPWHPLWCYLLSFPHPLSLVDLAADQRPVVVDCGVRLVVLVSLRADGSLGCCRSADGSVALGISRSACSHVTSRKACCVAERSSLSHVAGGGAVLLACSRRSAPASWGSRAAAAWSPCSGPCSPSCWSSWRGCWAVRVDRQAVCQAAHLACGRQSRCVGRWMMSGDGLEMMLM